ncbi:MATE family efflux transporter [Natrinema salaciae]|uniref:Multidrug-efflux transporter n=1 Tax=Natrinema salaciae TaxID=1186196 RepID=A0A1H9S9G4_9EURY|nr:MATE family efflux transporter [Natrinema salaciae]SER81013.1 putative efflux protein, MATE family [Natrinema salaciae]
MFNPIVWWFRWLARRLAGVGAIDDQRGRRIADLTWPRFLTMIARFSLRVSDIAMVGLALGSTAIVGISFAVVYWQFAFAFAIGIAGGTIGLVAQRYSAGQSAAASLVVKQSVLLGLALGLPFVVAYWLGAEELIRVFTEDSRTVRYGATYLRVSTVVLLFVTFNVVASRTLAGANNTWIPMSIRATGAAVNIGLNAIFIFGLGLGVFGAALASVIAEGLVAASFAYGLVRGEFPGLGPFPLTISLTGPYLDGRILRQLVGTSVPLIGHRLGNVFVRFPLLTLLAMVGPTVVASFEVARRVRNLLNAFGAGFSLSASSLVGQALGQSDEQLAVDFGRDTVVFSVIVYVLAGILVFALAPVIAGLFSRDPETVARTIPFVRVASVSFVGLGIFRTYEGILKGSGENRWTMYGRLLGLYLLLLPLTYLGVTTSLGHAAVFGALIAETWGAAIVTGYRVHSGKWTVASRSRRPSLAD